MKNLTDLEYHSACEVPDCFPVILCEGVYPDAPAVLVFFQSINGDERILGNPRVEGVNRMHKPLVPVRYFLVLKDWTFRIPVLLKGVFGHFGYSVVIDLRVQMGAVYHVYRVTVVDWSAGGNHLRVANHTGR